MTKQATTAALLWSAVLGASAIFGSYFFACVFPFAALSTIAALTLDIRRAAVLVGSVWAINQAVGFGFRDYPHDISTVAWGVVIGIGAFVALVAAKSVLRGRSELISPYAVVALLAAFVAYEGVLFAYALVSSGIENFSPTIVATVGLNDVLWFVGLGALHLVLTRTFPAVFGSRAALHSA
ncbi:MAG: hypothetical protein ABI898_09245 [Sphingomonadales bacterium]